MARNENNRVTLERTGRTPVIDVAMQDILAETQVARLEASPVTLVDKKAIFIHSAEQNGRPMENCFFLLEINLCDFQEVAFYLEF